ncbi:hypothetical protein ACJJBP_29355 [Pseudomonas aeruginosa]|uniref:hypothetical protein n=1 Tax=Pseudomonas aeruginosa TaxID=287 RepID=UPI0027C478A8|nr:hypothetical protein [Pseudomonas aeruginosa]MDQ2295500.1 hypothetical protein [Pseudomonas aeruginosa]
MNKALAEQAGGDERAAFERAFTVQEGIYFDDKRGEYRSMNLCAIEASDAQDLNLQLQGWQARAALAQPSPKCVKCGGTGEADSGGVHPWGEPVLIPCDCETEQAEAERPEVAEVAFVLRNIGAMDAEDIDGDNVDLRFEDAEGRDTGCDVSIVEYAEKAADLFEQHDRIVGALRAVITQLRQHKNDYMDAGQETYRALQNEIREREAEIARLDGLVSSRTTERDAALARVAEMEALMQMNFGELHTARNLLSRLSVSGVNVDAILGGQLQDLVIVPADATLEMVEALKRRLTVTNRGTLLNAGHALNASIAASPFAKKAPEPVMCPRCEGEGTLRTGIDESPSTICKRCDGVGTIAAAPGKEVPQAWLDVQAERRRQITAEGWTPEHDDLYCAAELPRAAAAYILNGANDEAPAIWSFSAKWWKPRDARSNYVRAGALILAEIERLDRAAPGKEVGHE